MKGIKVSPRYAEAHEESGGLRIRSHMRAIGEHVYLFTVLDTDSGMRCLSWSRLGVLWGHTSAITYTRHWTSITPDGETRVMKCSCGEERTAAPMAVESLAKAHERWHRSRGE